MTEKTQFTPEDVGRTFETSKEGVTVKLLSIGRNKQFPFIFQHTHDPNRFTISNQIGRTGMRGYYIYPSRPVEEQTELHPAIQHISAEGDISNETIELINKLAEIAYGSPVASKPTTNEESPSPHPCERSC